MRFHKEYFWAIKRRRIHRSYIVKYTGPDDWFGKSSAGGLDIAIHAGGRYYFSENFGGFAELGWGISPLQLGVTVRL